MFNIIRRSTFKLNNSFRFLATESNNLKVKSLVNKQSSLELTLFKSGSEKTLSFNPHWLRFNCFLCKDKSSGQRTIINSSIPFNLTIKNVKTSDQNVIIEWNDESKQKNSQLPLAFLVNHHPSENLSEEKFKRCTEIGFYDYSKFHDSNGERNDLEILKWYQHMVDYGVVVLKNVGTKEKTVRKIAELIAPLQKTIYGEEFDVRVEKDITNIALLDGDLPLHMDLPYYQAPPGLQFLHCIRFDEEIKGGESLLLDSFCTLEDFRKDHPVHFENLTKIPASWQYLIVGHQKKEVMIMSKPHIDLNHLNQIIGFTWSSDQEAPLKNMNEEMIKIYYESYLTLANYLKNNKNQIEYRMKPGELLVFNNRRFLHGRNGFSSMKGIRHFQGCYINIDEFMSEYRGMLVKKKLGMNEEKFFVDLSDIKMKFPTIGNNDFS